MTSKKNIGEQLNSAVPPKSVRRTAEESVNYGKVGGTARKRSCREYARPTVPKILIYTILVFIAPTFFKVCSGDVCRWQLSFLAGYKMFVHQAPGKLTILMVLLLFFMSYLLSAWIVSAFNMLKRRQKEIG